MHLTSGLLIWFEVKAIIILILFLKLFVFKKIELEQFSFKFDQIKSI